MKGIFIILILGFISFTGSGQPGVETLYCKVDGLVRSYKIYIPKTYEPDFGYPLVFVLHGGGGKASGMIRLTKHRFHYLAERDSFIVVYPNGYAKGWNDGDRDTLAEARRLNIDDVGFFDAMVDGLDKKYSIDRENIFACGISNGGFMVQRLAIERSSVFKAIGVVAANMSADQQKMLPENPVSVLFICGTADPLVPYRGGPVTVLNQNRGEVLSVAEAVQFWKEQNGCTQLTAVYDYPDLNKQDVSTAHKSVWQNPGDPNIRVVDIRIENGGHTWPGGRQYLPRRLVGNTNRDFNGCDEIWQFFKSVSF